MDVQRKLRFVTLPALASVIFISGGARAETEEEYDDDDPSALTDFHAVLDPVGAWVEDPTYGTVWVPTSSVVGVDFVPYQTGGHWAYGDDYTWVSDMPWGWAPFHYGRWALLEGRGWSWIPGRRYAPSWVTWETGMPGFGGWVGWTPMMPTWGWRGGVVFQFGFHVAPHYGYCERDHLFDPGFREHMLRGAGAEFVSSGMRPWEPHGEPHGDDHRGPPPDQIGIPRDHTPKPPENDPGLKKAKEFGHPATAPAHGGRPPAKTDHHGKDPAAPDHYPKGPDTPKDKNDKKDEKKDDNKGGKHPK